jgi:hypothetical protein
MLEYIESGGATPVPDGLTLPVYKADREAEYRSDMRSSVDGSGTSTSRVYLSLPPKVLP